jgi:hypothetical protein
VNDIVEQVTRRYGSLSEPKFHFVEQMMNERPYDRLIDTVRSKFQVIETTDEEEDHAFLHVLSRGHQSWAMYLSMVGPYAVFARVNPDQSWAEILTPETADLTADERWVVDTLTHATLRLMRRDELEQPIGLRLFVAQPGNTRVFQALFTDTDILPWDLDTLRDVGAI